MSSLLPPPLARRRVMFRHLDNRARRPRSEAAERPVEVSAAAPVEQRGVRLLKERVQFQKGHGRVTRVEPDEHLEDDVVQVRDLTEPLEESFYGAARPH